MADVPDPNCAPMPAPGPGPDHPCALLAMCVECGDAVELLLPVDQHLLSRLLAQRGWFISVLSPPGQGAGPMVLGPMCTACAQKIYPPEVFAVADQRRQQLLRSITQGPPASPGAR